MGRIMGRNMGRTTDGFTKDFVNPALMVDGGFE
jgi:hypothetical protein